MGSRERHAHAADGVDGDTAVVGGGESMAPSLVSEDHWQAWELQPVQ